MTTTELTIINAIRDEQLLQPFLGDLTTWRNWLIALRVLYGIRFTSDYGRNLIQTCMRRDPDLLPKRGFRKALFLTGRRSGKSRTAALIGAYEACLAGLENKLAAGEVGIVAILSPTKQQSKVIKRYLRTIFDSGVLQGQVVSEQTDGFTLRNGVRIQIFAGDFRSVRGYTLLCAIVDEICFFGVEEESKIRSDVELIRALQPALATTGGKLIAISSPYLRKGWSFKTYQRYFAKDAGDVLVWNAPSRIMNPTLPQSEIDQALREDPEAAKAEYLALWREDSAALLPREIIEQVVVRGRYELSPVEGRRYVGFVDLSGGRSDAAALAIGHLADDQKIILDFLKSWRSPFNTRIVVQEMASHLRRYDRTLTTGDNFAAEFVVNAFRDCKILYQRSRKTKSELYIEMLHQLSARNLELIDDDELVGQLAALERRPRSGGHDIIDHPAGGHDDLANVVAGVVVLAANRRRIAGPAGF